MFERAITTILLKTVATFPATLLTGPRQSGKTTWLRHLFPHYNYVNLEAPDVLLRVKTDPRGFLQSKEYWIIDEAQHCPELFSYLQEYMDQHRKPGQFILSGSQNFLLNEKISQTLAGRVAVLELLPLSYHEYLTNLDMPTLSLWQFLYQGSYPRPYQEHLDLSIWYSSYIRTYLERDVRSLLQIKDLTKFQLFLKLCAGRHGQLLNLSALANDCGISQTTATEWLSLLEASYILFRLRPHYRNFNKRMVKTPKLYFYDTAILCQLLGIESPEHLATHVSRGAIFEGYILAEIMKTYLAQGKTAPLYFWRDHLGVEIDAVLEQGDQLIAIEMKSSMTFNIDLLANLKHWTAFAGSYLKKALLVYAGDEQFIYDGMQVTSWDQFLNKIVSNTQ